MQTVDYQKNCHTKFLTSLLRVGRGWFANHALPSSHRDRRRHNARASSLSVLRFPFSARGVMRKLCAPAATSYRCSVNPNPQDSCTQKTW